MCNSPFARLSVLAVPLLLFVGCRGSTPTPSALPYSYAQQRQTLAMPAFRGDAKKIQHVVIVIQENRSFNNLFYGYPGARTATYGYNHKNKKIVLKPIVLETKWDLQHNSAGFFLSCNGAGMKIPGTKCRMNGFDLQQCRPKPNAPCPKIPAYAYVPQSEVQPYFDMAHQYVLADEFFASDFDTSSFIAHQYMIAAVNPNSSANYPPTAWGCPGGGAKFGDKLDELLTNPPRKILTSRLVPCWDPPTLADELDQKHIPWAFYAVNVVGTGGKNCGTGPDASQGRKGIWSAYQAIKHICYGADWNNDVISPPSQFLTDVQNGKLRGVTWVTPTYANSDHGGSGSKTGPSWVTSIVNAVGESKFWDSSVIFILWDDSGGWFDPQAPKYVDNDGFGFRLPLLIISPYALKGHVSHVQFEFGSIMRFTEDVFGLGRLAKSDMRARSPGLYCFDFKKPPRKFVPFAAPYDENYFKAQPNDERPPDTE